MRIEFDQLAERLRSTCGRSRVYFFANPGNWGDGLIRRGAVEFLNDSGIEYKELMRKPLTWIVPFLWGGVFVYNGSGAWCKFYQTGLKYCRLFSKRFRVVVLPSTFEHHFAIKNTEFFSRDRFESIEAMPDSTFCHDMAFYIGSVPSTPGEGSGYFFRLDAERNVEHEIPKTNVDVSREGNQLSDTNLFFERIARYETIYTDRLHVAIAGCLLGREVHLFSNNYFKIRAIYESSIKGNFERCIFHERPFRQRDFVGV